MRPQFLLILTVVSACAFAFMTFREGIPLWQHVISGLGLMGCIIYASALLVPPARTDGEAPPLAHPRST